MSITTTKPVVTEAVEAQTFDKIWMQRLQIDSRDLNGECQVSAVLMPFYEDAEGLRTPSAGNNIKLTIKDVFAISDLDKTKAAALLAILADCTPNQQLALLQVAILDTVKVFATEKELI